jgi:hypothetical protein
MTRATPRTNKHKTMYAPLTTSTALMTTLKTALTVKRPHSGKAVRRFTEWLHDNLPTKLKPRTFIDAAGNLHVDARIKKSHRTLFVAHVDTVHREDGKNLVKVKNDTWHAYGGVPLGADDGAGVAMLMHLLHSGKSAYYIFTQGEECGGIGATFIAKQYADLLSEFDRAIAFDRRGIDSIISHQGYGRCCSDSFAQALANAFNDIDPDAFMYAPDDSGVYTDTAEFTTVIPECTNISIGYYNEHTERESLNITHFTRLAAAAAKLDWDELPTERDPSVVEEKVWGGYKGYSSYYDTAWWDGDDGTWEDYADTKYKRLDAIDALMDATQGFTGALREMMAMAAYPDDIELALKHIRVQNLGRDELDYALEAVQAGFDVDTVMLDLFDMCHTH